MPNYPNLPGVLVSTVDGGLAARRAPRAKSILVLGTSGEGPVSGPYPVVDRAAAADVFGFEGNLIRGMEEVALSDNLFLYRIGTKAGTASKIGGETVGDPGFTVTLGQRVADADTRYKLWYDAGILYVWFDGNLVYANDTGADVIVDTGDVVVSGVATAGEPLGDQAGLAKTLAGAITIAAAVAITPQSGNEDVVYVAPVTGVGMTGRETYIALEKAYDLLQTFPVQEVYVPGVVLDNPNIAFYVAADATTAANNPVTNVDALEWLKTIKNADGTRTYHWSKDSVNSDGGVATPQTFTSAADRLSKDYHEVNFGYQLARFCAAQSAVQASVGVCVGFIGMAKPAKFDLQTTRDWIGFLPVTDANGVVTTAGRGLCGNPYMVGTTAAKLHPHTHDNGNGWRMPGFFETTSGEYDGGASLDRNRNPIDIGAYLHVAGDWAQVTNGYGTYVGSIAGWVAGYVAGLDDKSSTTNKPVTALRMLHQPNLAQLDSLTKAKINVLRFKGPLQAPVLLHGRTAAADASDYINLVRQRIKGLVIRVVYEEADKFLGETSIDGLQLQALKTKLDSRMLELQKRGYVSRFSFVISATEAEQRIGHASIDISFVPADELVRLNATIGISRR